MGKRIEEFTVEDVSKGIAERYDTFTVNSLIEAILDYIKANLDTGKREPMSVELVSRNTAKRIVYKWRDSVSDREYWTGLKDSDWTTLIDAVREAISVQQGFVPDWSKAPKWAKSARVFWSEADETINAEYAVAVFPRPAPKMQHKTVGEMINDLAEKYDWQTGGPEVKLLEAVEDVNTIEGLCRAAGIPLETPDE